MKRAVIAAVLAIAFTIASAVPASAALIQAKLAGNCSQHVNVAFVLQVCYEFDDDDKKGGGKP